ncbi:hypothetical protein ACEPAH_1991 [Sanghuangporus vaninii]
MIIPLPSILRVSANAYTILQETFEQVFLRGIGEDWFSGIAYGRSRDSEILVLGDTIAVPSGHAAADIQTPHPTTTAISISSVATAIANRTASTPYNKVPSIIASPPPSRALLVSENGIELNVSVSAASAASETSSSLDALRAGSSLASASNYSPCLLLRRAEPTSLGSSLSAEDSEIDTGFFPSNSPSSPSTLRSIPSPFPFPFLTPRSEPFSSINSDFSSPLSSSSTRPPTGTNSNGVTPTWTSTDESTALSTPSEMPSSTDLTSLSASGFPTSITVLPSATSLSSDPDESDTATTTFVFPTPSSSISPSTPFSPSFTTLPSPTISEASTDGASSSSSSGTDASTTFSETSSVVSTSTMDNTSSVSTTTGDSTSTSASTTDSTDAGTSTSTGFDTSLSVTNTETIPTSTSSEFSFSLTSLPSISVSGTSSDPQTISNLPSSSLSLSPSPSGTQISTVFSGNEPSSTSFPFLTSRSSRHMSATVIMSSTITMKGQSSSALETITTTFVTSRAGGTPMTITSVVVGPSGSLNDGTSSRRNMSSGAIAGIAIVSALAVITVALWICFAVRRRRRRYVHRNTHYSVAGRASSYSPDGSGGPGMRSLRSSMALRSGYGLPGRGRSNSSGLLPIRTSPLQGEDDDELDAMHSSSAHSGPGSLEAGMMTQVNPVAPAHTTYTVGYPILPGWRTTDAGGANLGDSAADRIRGGAGSAVFKNERFSPDGTGNREWARQLLDAAGIGSSTAASNMPSRPGSSGFYGQDFRYPKRASFVLGSLPPAPRARSASPPELMTGVGAAVARSTLLPTRSETFDIKDTRRSTITRSNSNSAFQRRSLPPSAWPVIDTSRSMSKGKEKDASSSPVRANEPNTETFGRTRSHSGSAENSSSGHGHGQSSRVVTSSQGHRSATASGENERTFNSSSGSGSTGSHQGGTGAATQSQSQSQNLIYSRKQSKRRSNSMDGGLFARAASLARGSLRTHQGRPSSSGILFNDVEVTAKRPPSPVSRLVPSVPISSSTSTLTPSTPTIGAVIPPSPAPSRVPSALLRQQSPGPISLPPRSPSALMMMRASGTGLRDSGVGLPVILATPSPLPTPDFLRHSHHHHIPDGRLDPRLAARLQEIHNVQSSMSTVGLKDNEDYSRPILPLVKNRDNRDSLTSASSEYSQPSRPESDDDRTPTQPNMRM